MTTFASDLQWKLSWLKTFSDGRSTHPKLLSCTQPLSSVQCAIWLEAFHSPIPCIKSNISNLHNCKCSRINSTPHTRLLFLGWCCYCQLEVNKVKTFLYLSKKLRTAKWTYHCCCWFDWWPCLLRCRRRCCWWPGCRQSLRGFCSRWIALLSISPWKAIQDKSFVLKSVKCFSYMDGYIFTYLTVSCIP